MSFWKYLPKAPVLPSHPVGRENSPQHSRECLGTSANGGDGFAAELDLVYFFGYQT